MADLPKRLWLGDLGALQDPALPLHLLAEPDAEWWREGARACARVLLRALWAQVPARTPALHVLERWAHRSLDLAEVSADRWVRRTVDQWVCAGHRITDPRLDPGEVLEQTVASVLDAVRDRHLALRRLVTLAHSLHALAGSLPGLGAPLAVLGRYVPEAP
jgi:hypothetical protein